MKRIGRPTGTFYIFVFFALLYGGFYVGSRFDTPFEYWWSFPTMCTWLYVLIVTLFKSVVDW